MKFFVVLVMFVMYATADCGCLRCSKHLHGVEILGPDGCPVKVVFRSPKQYRSDYSYASEVPQTGYNHKVSHLPQMCCQKQISDCGGQEYSATIQAPLPLPSSLPKISLPLLNNLKYRTDTVVVAAPTASACGCNRGPAPAPALSIDIVNWLKNLQLSLPAAPTTPTLVTDYAAPTTGPTFDRLECNSCPCRLDNYPILTATTDYIPQCICSNKRTKRSLISSRLNLETSDLSGATNDSAINSRNKRDLATHGYNFLMNMLPQYVRDPLHHSIRGVSVDKPTKPSLKQKIEELKMKKTPNYSLYDLEESHSNYLLPKRTRPSQEAAGFGYSSRKFWEKDTPPAIASKKDILQSFLEGKSAKQISSSLRPSLSEPEDSFVDSKYRSFAQKLSSSRLSYGNPKFTTRASENPALEEATLLRKLKRLNGNHFSSDVEQQATDFMKELLEPEEKRTKRFTEPNPESTPLARKKRTIVLSSDEIDLPAHYEIDIVSVEDEEPDTYYGEDLQSSDAYDEEDESPRVGLNSPFLRKLSASSDNRFSPGLSRFQPKPDVVVGKSVIQKAVREELDHYHTKIEREQKVKDMRANLQRKPQSLVPHNPIFMLLTAPMKFLRHFHDVNKGINPVMTSLPKLVYTTKKYFRDFGKNFQKNCMNLASDIIGDFDHVQPNVIQRIAVPDGGRFRRNVLKADLKKCLNNNQEIDGIETNIETPHSDQEQKGDEKCDSAHTESSSASSEEAFFRMAKDSIDPNIAELIPNEYSHRLASSISESKQFTPDYSLEFKNSKETQNFREVSEDHVRKKRYVIKVVDDREMQDQIEDYLIQKMDDKFTYLKPLQDYHNKVNDFFSNVYSSHDQPSTLKSRFDYPVDDYPEDSFENSFERPKKKQIQIKKVKPRVIIDNKGLPFMEYDGYKRPLLLNSKRFGLLQKSAQERERSSEETGSRIATLIARAKEDPEVVGSAPRDIAPQQIVKERISSLLEEVDQLVHLNPEEYDEIFEHLIRVQHIKTSIEQDWKRILIENKVEDVGAKIGLLSKFKDLQQVKDSSVRIIAQALKKNDNEFVRRQLVHSLIRLQKLQCLISSVVEEFDQHLKIKTSFNTKKEIKYVDFLSELKFVYANTRNDLIKKLCKDRDAEGLKTMELLQKLKKLILSADVDTDKFDRSAKLIWEIKNLEKLQMQTIQDMNKKLFRNFKVKKELKILFDLQKRFDECETELNELLGNLVVVKTAAAAKTGHKKDMKEIIAEIKQKHEEMIQKAKERAGSLHRLKNS